MTDPHAPENVAVHYVGSLPPYSVSYIDPKVCGTRTDQWFVMGTVDGDPRNPQGPAAICEYEPTAHAIAALLNACVNPLDHVVSIPGPDAPQWGRGWRISPQRWDWLRSIRCALTGHRWDVNARATQRSCVRCWVAQDRSNWPAGEDR